MIWLVLAENVRLLSPLEQDFWECAMLLCEESFVMKQIRKETVQELCEARNSVYV